jgi:two-component system, NtrC family, sensor kinase
MSRRRPGLWSEIAVAMVLISIVATVLNAGITWLLVDQSGADRRTELAVGMSNVLATQLELEASRGEHSGGWRRVVSAYEGQAVDLAELWVCDRSLATLASVAGEAPRVPDQGLRAALYAGEQYTQIEGGRGRDRRVAVTTPIAPRGQVVGAVRVVLPLSVGGLGPLAYALLSTAVSGSLIGLFGFYLFRRGLLRPVQVLADGTRRIAAGGFGEQVEVDAARELQDLAVALSAMSMSLAEYQQTTTRQLEALAAANADLRHAQEMLVRSQRLAGVGRLAAGLAHEVGNPLAAVLGYVELLLADPTDPDSTADILRRARTELGRVHRIVRQLLDYARPGGGAPEPVAVDAALRAAITSVAHLPTFRQIDLRIVAEPDLPLVSIAPDRLHQALVNLLLNAGDSVASTGRRGVVELSGRAAQGGVAIRCSDDGPGFAPGAIEQALEPFFTTKDVGQGTGLGLATCLTVAEAAGGRIELAAREGGGAEVLLWLPAGAALAS